MSVVTKCVTLVEGLNLLQCEDNLCFDKMYMHGTKILVAERVAGECHIVGCNAPLSFDSMFDVTSSLTCRDDIEEDDILILANGVELEIASYDFKPIKELLLKETGVITCADTLFDSIGYHRPNLFAWNRDLTYNNREHGLLDVVMIKRGSQILKTPAYIRHNYISVGDKVTIDDVENNLYGYLLTKYEEYGYMEVIRLVDNRSVEIGVGGMSIVIDSSKLSRK